MTPAQLLLLKTAINADPAFNELKLTTDGRYAIATAFNLPATPDFIVWRSAISTYDVRSVLVWSEYDNLSISKQNAFQFLNSNGFVDARLINVRTGIGSIFSGPGQAGNLSTLTVISKRKATRFEKVVATGPTGFGVDLIPGISPFSDGYTLSFQAVDAALNS